MNRRTLPIAAALATAAALLLAACAGNDNTMPKNPAMDAGVGTGATKLAAPSASAPDTDAATRPKITLPSDVSDTFTPEKVGDPTQDTILSDNAEFVRALDAAVVVGKPDYPPLSFYTDGEGTAASQSWVKSFADSNQTITGATQYFNRRVTVKSEILAFITYCGDESKSFSTAIKTRKVNRTKVTPKSYVSYRVQVKKSDAGVWQVLKISSLRGAASCQP
ncbi:hypothetical protein OG204_21970 [Streptomyces sp. NBC_01387]|uniref:hypothetical protein n=2 Tax=Streptomyces TaxID=1883 RepID=UPI002DD7A793|nr:hypothetical protein [Streptomyces sp. NBC_01766]WSC20590.1 hypothetical protein OIE60_13315 [Streptomyces sp. NBC_01766]